MTVDIYTRMLPHLCCQLIRPLCCSPHSALVPNPDQTARTILHQLASRQCTSDDYEHLLNACVRTRLHLGALLEDIIVRYMVVVAWHGTAQ